MIYEIKQHINTNTEIKQKKLILSCEISDNGNFTLLAEKEDGEQNKIFSLTREGTGYLYSYIQDSTGLQLDDKGKLIINEDYDFKRK